MNLKIFLNRFASRNDVESEAAFFKTHVPWVAPEAYLNILFKPLPLNEIQEFARRLLAPKSLTSLYDQCNGAILLSGALSVYGVLPPGRLLHRTNIFLRAPFNIESENENWKPEDGRYFLIAGYGYDGSAVCIHRDTGEARLFRRSNVGKLIKTSVAWNSLDTWISSETERLAALFDFDGRLMVDKRYTVPTSNNEA